MVGVTVLILVALPGALYWSLRRAFRVGPDLQEAEPFGPTDPDEVETSALGFDADDLARLADIWTSLLCDGASWVIRRKETVTLLDTTTLRRKTSIDFVVPSSLRNREAVPSRDDDRVLVPLFFLDKSPATFTRFDFADEAQGSLPLPTMSENAIVSAAILRAAARAALGHEPPRLICDELTAIAVCPPPESLTYLAAYTRRSVGPDDGHSRRVALRADKSFIWLASTLAYSSVVVVPVAQAPGVSRHIVKVAFDQTVDDFSKQRIRDFGWEPLEIWADSPFVGAKSYHFEAEVTPSVEILDALTITEFQGDIVELRGTPARSPRVHLYVPSAERAQNSVARVRFRVQRETFGLGALVAALLICAVLALCVGFAGHIAVGSTAVAGLLMAFPSVVVAYVLRGTGHDLATRLAWRSRGILFVAGLLPLVAAGRLSAERISVDSHPTAYELRLWWVPLLGLATLCAVALLLAFIFPRATPSAELVNRRVDLSGDDE